MYILTVLLKFLYSYTNIPHGKKKKELLMRNTLDKWIYFLSISPCNVEITLWRNWLGIIWMIFNKDMHQWYLANGMHHSSSQILNSCCHEMQPLGALFGMSPCLSLKALPFSRGSKGPAASKANWSLKTSLLITKKLNITAYRTYFKIFKNMLRIALCIGIFVRSLAEIGPLVKEEIYHHCKMELVQLLFSSIVFNKNNTHSIQC